MMAWLMRGALMPLFFVAIAHASISSQQQPSSFLSEQIRETESCLVRPPAEIASCLRAAALRLLHAAAALSGGDACKTEVSAATGCLRTSGIHSSHGASDRNEVTGRRRETRATVPALPTWAACKDKPVDYVKQAAKLIGRHDWKAFTCPRAKYDGACILPQAPKVCRLTCNLCETPEPWDALHTGSSCLSPTQNCDSAAQCGETIRTAEGCLAAANELPIQINGTRTRTHPPALPLTCVRALACRHIYVHKHVLHTTAKYHRHRHHHRRHYQRRRRRRQQQPLQVRSTT